MNLFTLNWKNLKRVFFWENSKGTYHQNFGTEKCFFYKVLKSQSTSYLFKIVPSSNTECQASNLDNIASFFVKNYYLEWNKLDGYISNACTLRIFKIHILTFISYINYIGFFEVFKKCILSFIRSVSNSFFNIVNQIYSINWDIS